MKEIRLRAVEPEDTDFILECEADRKASIWSDVKAPLSRSQIQTYALTYDADPFSAGQLRMIIECGEPVGIIDLYDINQTDGRAFAGICIHPGFRKKGLAVKSLRSLIEYNGERLGLNQILAKVSSQNEVALKAFLKAGFKKIALLPRWHRIGMSYHDFHLLSSSPED